MHTPFRLIYQETISLYTNAVSKCKQKFLFLILRKYLQHTESRPKERLNVHLKDCIGEINSA